MPNDNLAMGYRPRCESEEQLVNDMDEEDCEEERQEELEQAEQAEQEELEYQAQEHPNRHVSFVTDPRMSSWSAKDDDPSSSTKLGYVCYYCSFSFMHIHTQL